MRYIDSIKIYLGQTVNVMVKHTDGLLGILDRSNFSMNIYSVYLSPEHSVEGHDSKFYYI